MNWLLVTKQADSKMFLNVIFKQVEKITFKVTYGSNSVVTNCVWQDNVPEEMPPLFAAIYTPIAAAGTQGQIKHVARLLATQLNAVKLGPGYAAAKPTPVVRETTFNGFCMI